MTHHNSQLLPVGGVSHAGGFTAFAQTLGIFQAYPRQIIVHIDPGQLALHTPVR